MDLYTQSMSERNKLNPLVMLRMVVARRTDKKDGWTWTTATRLGEILVIAENAYGDRDNRYTILGCEFSDDGPRVWFPGSERGRKHAVVQLSLHALTSEPIMIWQLAQETIHLLDPHPGAANLLEEGVSILFARDYMRMLGLPIPASLAPNYSEAASLVGALEATHPGAARLLREESGRWRDVTEGTILRLFPDFDPVKAGRLVSRFA